ncbi:MAG: hypothetical protein ABIR68_11815 [Ilumatobacteraceae bacterium]
MTTDPRAARRLHQAIEPYHGMIYFVPEGPQHYAAIKLDGTPMMGYFASRSAAMGAVGAEVVIATFFNFHPDLVRAAIPAAWERATPGQAGLARLTAVDEALRRMLGSRLGDDDVVEVAALTRRAAEACTSPGRPLYAAHAQIDWPDEAHLQLWHAATLLREFRGDGHIACLVEQGIDPCEVLVIHAASGPGAPSRRALQGSRQWSDEEWAAATERLVVRGWLDADGALTDSGRASRTHVEDRTDELAAPTWGVLDEGEQQRVVDVGRELSQTIIEAGTFGRR